MIVDRWLIVVGVEGFLLLALLTYRPGRKLSMLFVGQATFKGLLHFRKLSEIRITVCADVFRSGTGIGESLLFSFFQGALAAAETRSLEMLLNSLFSPFSFALKLMEPILLSSIVGLHLPPVHSPTPHEMRTMAW